MIIYISGPVSGVKNFEEPFNRAKEAIEVRGYETLSILDCEFMQKDAFKWSDCMKFCIAMLEKCCGIVMLDGWKTSVGATIEKAWAEKLGIRVYDGFESIYTELPDA